MHASPNIHGVKSARIERGGSACATWTTISVIAEGGEFVICLFADDGDVEIIDTTREDEPEPDYEPSEIDDSSYRRDMIDAGRGHLLR